jgi:hypothetical protein
MSSAEEANSARATCMTIKTALEQRRPFQLDESQAMILCGLLHPVMFESESVSCIDSLISLYAITVRAYHQQQQQQQQQQQRITIPPQPAPLLALFLPKLAEVIARMEDVLELGQDVLDAVNEYQNKS